MGTFYPYIENQEGNVGTGRGSEPKGGIILDDASTNVFIKTANLFAEAVRNIVPILIGTEHTSVELGTPLTGTFQSFLQMKQDSLFFTIREPSIVSLPLLGWINRSLALRISTLMRGEEAEELNEALLSALGEAFNNILGAFDSALKDEFKKTMEHSDIKLLDQNTNNIIAETGLNPTSSVCLIPMSVGVEDFTSEMGLLIGIESLNELYNHHPLSKQERKTMIPTPPIQSSSGQSQQKQDIPLARFEELIPQRPAGEPKGIELIMDVPLEIAVELGRKKLTVKEILGLAPGSLVELEKLAGETVDLYVNGKLFAKGEVVVIEENFGVRIVSIVSPKERVEKMR